MGNPRIQTLHYAWLICQWRKHRELYLLQRKVNILGNFLIDCGLSESTGDLELDRVIVERKVLKQCKDEIKNLQDIVDGLEGWYENNSRHITNSS